MIAKLPSISVFFFLICACSQEESPAKRTENTVNTMHQIPQKSTPKKEHHHDNQRIIPVKVIAPSVVFPDPEPEPFPYYTGEPMPMEPMIPITLPSNDSIYDIAATMPEFPGGQQAMLHYLNLNLHYPELAKELGIEGKVFVSFVVFEDGSIHNETILRGINGNTSCDQEALRLVKQMPNWIPGRNENGDKLKIRVKIPVVFRLN
ncbi:MAG: hypothetical protein RJB36_543 [Bacteroidota bacterium]|jgi:TonB family protein